MRRDHRPYFVKKIWFRLLKLYVDHFLRPQLDGLGKNPYIVKPWYIEVFGSPVTIGDNITLLASPDKRTRLTVWSDRKDILGIRIGDHVLISPGVRISAAQEITIGDNCMIASSAYITDSDWHGIYDRSLPPDTAYPVKLKNNVWIGNSAIICKGVTIGENSIIGAGAVVSNDIPPNSIAVGNPARVVKQLDPNRKITTRKDRFGDIDLINMNLDLQEKELLKGNTLTGWLRSIIIPMNGD
ncbi:MAG: acyltransferase [Desulfamplus sp.]|nr:acyltransferase [Desulfamplus sp.]